MTKALLFIFTALIIGGRCNAADLDSLVSCIYDYESNALVTDASDDKIEYLRLKRSKYPTLEASVSSGKDFTNSERNPQATSLDVALSMNVYSSQMNSAIEAQEHRAKASDVQEAIAGIELSNDRIDQIFGLLSVENESVLLGRRKEEQLKVKGMLDVLVRSKVLDGVQALLASVAVQQTELKLLQIKEMLKQAQGRLQDFKIYDKNWATPLFWEEIFRNQAVSKTPVVVLEKKQNAELFQAEQLEIEARKNAWIPTLSVSLAYQQNLDHIDAMPFEKQTLGRVILSMPIDQLFGVSTETKLRNAQALRIQLAGERRLTEVQRLHQNQLDEIELLGKTEVLLQQGIQAASLARQGIVVKLKHSRGDFTELSSIDDQLLSLEKSLFENKVQRWKMIAKSRMKEIVAGGKINACKNK